MERWHSVAAVIVRLCWRFVCDCRCSTVEVLALTAVFAACIQLLGKRRITQCRRRCLSLTLPPHSSQGALRETRIFLQATGGYMDVVSSYGWWRGSWQNPITEPFFSLLSHPAAPSAGFLFIRVGSNMNATSFACSRIAAID